MKAVQNPIASQQRPIFARWYLLVVEELKDHEAQIAVEGRRCMIPHNSNTPNPGGVR
jgi:hypothetical protein